MRAFWFNFESAHFGHYYWWYFCIYLDFHFGIKKAINVEWKYGSSSSSSNENPMWNKQKVIRCFFFVINKEFWKQKKKRKRKNTLQFICVSHSNQTWLTLSLVVLCVYYCKIHMFVCLCSFYCSSYLFSFFCLLSKFLTCTIIATRCAIFIFGIIFQTVCHSTVVASHFFLACSHLFDCVCLCGYFSE